jgi:hypothetical protein
MYEISNIKIIIEERFNTAPQITVLNTNSLKYEEKENLRKQLQDYINNTHKALKPCIDDISNRMVLDSVPVFEIISISLDGNEDYIKTHISVV